MKKFLFTSLLVQSISAQSFVSKIYGQILGNTDVKREYKDLAYQALKDFGIKNPACVSVKKMNHIGPMFALMPLSSFTAFGIWLDEEYLDTCSPAERIFQIYHEASHYAYKHHQKLLTIGSLTLATTIAVLMYLNKKLTALDAPHPLAITTATGILVTATLYVGLLPKIVKQQEKMADITAAKKLISLRKKEIVDTYIQKLASAASTNNSNLWWLSNQEQIKYLTQLDLESNIG